MAIELYHNAVSTCSQKVRIPLAEKNVEWTSHPVDLLKGEQKNPEYLKLNPNGVVPTLVHDGRVIIESSIINEYVAEAFAGVSLYPTSLADKADMRLWTRLVDEKLHTANGVVTIVTVRRSLMMQRPREEVLAEIKAQSDESQLAARISLFDLGVEAPECISALRAISSILSKVEARVNGHDWLAGDSFTLADASVTPYVARMEQIGMSWLWEDNLYPALGRWFARVKSRPSFETAVTRFVPEGMPALFRNLAAPSMDKIKSVFEETLKAKAA